ncbi:MAG: M36 family metallopeptidase [Flavobacteriales bacterium]
MKLDSIYLAKSKVTSTFNLCISLIFFLLTAQQSIAQIGFQDLKQLLQKESGKHNLKPSDFEHLEMLSNYVDRHSKVNYITLQQSVGGYRVHNAFLQIALNSKLEIVSIHNSAIDNIQERIKAGFASEIVAVFQAAVNHLALPKVTVLSVAQPLGNNMYQIKVEGLKKDVVVEKILYPANESNVVSAWRVELQPINSPDWWNIIISDADLNVLATYNYNRECKHSEIGKSSHYHHTCEMEEHHVSMATDAIGAYKVFPFPVESPIFGPRSLIQDASDAVASPFGWHDTNGQPGADFLITRGNNTFVYEDANDSDTPGYSPNGGNNLVFDFPYLFENSPLQNRDAALTNLFYWNNLIHDVLYHNGFDEESGNFQQNNYGRGGLQNDHVIVEGQDGGGTNNANFATPPDGSNPRMQVYLWYLGLGNFLKVLSPEPIAGGYSGSTASFGPEIPEVSIIAEIVLVNDGSNSPTLGCNPLVNASALQGKIAMFDRGECTFVSKVQNAQNAGALAVIIVNNQPNGVVQMGGTSSTITIPVIMISQADGNLIKPYLSQGVLAEFGGAGSGEVFDCSFDNGVIAHEYGHGVSNRLTAGPSVTTCLFNEEQMGEGWSDFLSLVFSHLPDQTAETPRGIGNFVTGNPTDGPGIRPFPYTRNMSVNPHTYISIRNVSVPHGVGSVWCAMLWDLYWNLIDRYGFDPDLINGNGGNRIALKLVMEGMKLQACQPGFIDGRDAILLADDILYNGIHTCLIWHTFARRGLGLSASQGSSNNVLDGSQAFDIPFDCSEVTDFAIVNNAAACVSKPVTFNDLSLPIATSRSWSFPGAEPSSSTLSNPTVVYNSPGTYTATLTITNSLGTSTTSKQVVVSNSPVFSITANNALNGQDGSASVNIISAQSPFNIVFNTIPPVNNFEVGGLVPGNYSVTVSDASGCATTQDFEIGNFVGISEGDELIISIYPNPSSNGLFNIQLKNQNLPLETLEIIDISGRRIDSQFIWEDSVIKLDLANKAPGFYYMKLKTGEQIITRKLIKR